MHTKQKQQNGPDLNNATANVYYIVNPGIAMTIKDQRTFDWIDFRRGRFVVICCIFVLGPA